MVNALMCGWIFNVLSSLYILLSIQKGLESHKYWNLLIFFVNLSLITACPMKWNANVCEYARIQPYCTSNRNECSPSIFNISHLQVRENRKYTEDRILQLLQNECSLPKFKGRYLPKSELTSVHLNFIWRELNDSAEVSRRLGFLWDSHLFLERVFEANDLQQP